MAYIKTKPSTIRCETCGEPVPVNPGPGRKPKFCPAHRAVKNGGLRAGHSEQPEPYAPRSLADHPALVARIEKNGPGRAAAHRPLGIRTDTTTGKVPRRRGNE